MARFVNVGSLLFEQGQCQGRPDAGEIVLRETEQSLNALKGTGLDLIVLSESVESIGMGIEDAEEVDHPGPFLKLYMDFASSAQCHVAGSIKLREGDTVHNSVVFVGPDGNVLGAYHKANLTFGEMEGGLTSGKAAVVVDTAIGRLGGAICFDLNFEWIRKQYSTLQPDIMVFASVYHGGFMQKLWAYECGAFFISALPFHGGGILDPLGEPLALTDCYAPVARARINLDRAVVHLDYNREKFADMKKQYGDEIEISIPKNLGPALIYSLSQNRTAADIVREFELELRTDYMQRALKANRG